MATWSWLFCLFGLCVSSVHGAWILQASTLPSGDSDFAVGAYNGTIFILGGYNNPRQTTEYQIYTDSFALTQPLPTELRGFAQYWCQWKDTMYIIEPSGSTLSSFHMTTKQYTPGWININTNVGPNGDACLAAANDRLFITGGWTNNGARVTDTLQVLRLTELEWIIDTPMQQSRVAHACVAHYNHLWVFGGDSKGVLNTNERISITNVASNQWHFIDPLSEALFVLRAAAWHQTIFVTGGAAGGVYSDKVHIADAITGEVVVSPDRLVYDVSYHGIVVAQNAIYLFGGFSASYVDTWMRYELTAPTANPISTTNDPTTMEPTTSDPTTAPTTADPTTAIPTTAAPTTSAPTTDQPTSAIPTTTQVATTHDITSSLSTTVDPVTSAPTTNGSSTSVHHSTVSPLTIDPTTQVVTTEDPTTVNSTNANTVTTQVATTEEANTWLVVSISWLAGFLICGMIALIMVFLKKLRNQKSIERKVMKQSGPSNAHAVVDYRPYDPLLVAWLVDTVQLPQFLDVFVQNGYDNLLRIELIDDREQLAEIGITMVEYQALIMSEIENLRRLPISKKTSDVGYKKNSVKKRGEVELGPITVEGPSDARFVNQELEAYTEEGLVVPPPPPKLQTLDMNQYQTNMILNTDQTDMETNIDETNIIANLQWQSNANVTVQGGYDA